MKKEIKKKERNLFWQIKNERICLETSKWKILVHPRRIFKNPFLENIASVKHLMINKHLLMLIELFMIEI